MYNSNYSIHFIKNRLCKKIYKTFRFFFTTYQKKMATITREQLYQRYLSKQEEINKQLQQDIEKIQQEILYQNEVGKTRITMAYNASANENGYLDVLVKRIQAVFIDSHISVSKNNEITIDWTFPIHSTTL
jgi:hypothetical protein